jgi:4-oxalocrotonate tautomerase
MPLVEIKLLEDVFSDQEKLELIERCTDVIVAIKGENLRPVTWVLVQDLKSGDWGIGGQGLRTEDAQELIAAPTTA